MGFLGLGTPYSWEESQAVLQYVKDHGLLQFLHVWNANKDRTDDHLRWGEEVEFTLVEMNAEALDTSVFDNATEIIGELKVREGFRSARLTHLASEWHPEFANHMVEAIPSPPYSVDFNSLLMLEPSMRLRRAKIQSLLPPNCFVCSPTAFPRFGLPGFSRSRLPLGTRSTDPDPFREVSLAKDTEETRDAEATNLPYACEESTYCSSEEPPFTRSQQHHPPFDNSITDSIFIPDSLVNPHPRFGTLVRNIRSRRGAKPFVAIPLFNDIRSGTTPTEITHEEGETALGETNWSKAMPIDSLDRYSVEKLAKEGANGFNPNPVADHIYMDCFAFGMGMSCVQTTFACSNIRAARYLYDQLLVLAPIFLALTASTPILRGLLADTDTRWSTLEQAVDCRTEAELKQIAKSRYSAASLYISDREPLVSQRASLNDTSPLINERAHKMLLENGMDDILATHFAHLWIRDPMVIFVEKVDLDDRCSMDHFENIQSTNWNSVRFKPPLPLAASGKSGETERSPIGWRVEFRTPEIQLTDFDNAAGVALITVLAQMIQTQGLELYIPMSMNDENMRRSWSRNAITEQRFFFRADISSGTKNTEVAEMTLYEILVGCPRVGFRGLVPLCEEFLNGEVSGDRRCGVEARKRFSQYCELMILRASGKLLTCAQFLRKFVTSHPKYQNDSVVSRTIAYDVITLATNIGFGVWTAPELHGEALGNLIRQTPLPSTTLLPQFSPAAARELVCFVDATEAGTLAALELGTAGARCHDGAVVPPSLSNCDIASLAWDRAEKNINSAQDSFGTETSRICGTPSKCAPIVLLRKRAIVLNEIKYIYTMPVSVTSRTGSSYRLGEGSGMESGGSQEDIYRLAFRELVRAAQQQQQLSSDPCMAPGLCSVHSGQVNTTKKTGTTGGLSGAVSNEDFTRAWILKGFDLLGQDDDDLVLRPMSRSRCSYGRRMLAFSPVGSGNGAVDSSAASTSAGFDAESWRDLEDNNSCCCLTEGACGEYLDEDAMHELSRNVNLGFETEEELEYFKQVCDASA